MDETIKKIQNQEVVRKKDIHGKKEMISDSSIVSDEYASDTPSSGVSSAYGDTTGFSHEIDSKSSNHTSPYINLQQNKLTEYRRTSTKYAAINRKVNNEYKIITEAGAEGIEAFHDKEDAMLFSSSDYDGIISSDMPGKSLYGISTNRSLSELSEDNKMVGVEPAGKDYNKYAVLKALKNKNMRNSVNSKHGKVNSVKSRVKNIGRKTIGRTKQTLNRSKRGMDNVRDIFNAEADTLEKISELKHETLIRRAVGLMSKPFIATARMIISSILKFAVFVVKKILSISLSFLTALMGPAGFLVIIILIIVIITTIPPFSYIFGGADGGTGMIVITVQDTMREFGISIDGNDINDTCTINYNLDIKEAEKEALYLFLAKKGTDYSLSDITQEDAELYSKILSELIEQTVVIDMYTTVEDGSLLCEKILDNCTRKASDDSLNNYDGYVQGSCNEHGIIAEYVGYTNGSTGQYKHHIDDSSYFIPCEVSQYSVIPVGTCLELTTINPTTLERTNYILQVVDYHEDEAEDNNTLYLCGAAGLLNVYIDNEPVCDYNIITKEYGAVSWYSYNYGVADRFNRAPDSDTAYTGLLDKRINMSDAIVTYNVRYRSPGSIIEEFELDEELDDDELEEMFGDYYRIDVDNLSDEELERLKKAGIVVPKKTINVINKSAIEFMLLHSVNTSDELYFSTEDRNRYDEIKDMLEGSSDDVLANLIGDMSVSKAMSTLDEEFEMRDSSYQDPAAFLYEVMIDNGMYIPANAGLLAKFCDDNGYTVSESEAKSGGAYIEFVSLDYGTYKDITDIIIHTAEGNTIYYSQKAGRVVSSTEGYPGFRKNALREDYVLTVQYAKFI